MCISIIDVVLDSVSGSTMSSTGFVTFDDLATVTCAAKAPLSHDHNNLKASLAPDPSEIRWENAHENDTYSKGREWTVSDGRRYLSGLHLYILSSARLSSDIFLFLICLSRQTSC